MEGYNERSLCVKYRSQGVQTSFYESTPSTRDLLGPEEILGMQEQISLMLQKNAVTEVPPNSPGFYSNVFLVRKASGRWRPVIDLKSLNAHILAPHFRMFTTSSVLSTVRKGDYAFKIDLQDAYFHVPIHPSSRKVCFRKQGLSVSGTPLLSEHSPSVTRLGHKVTGYLHRLGISVVPYLDDWLVHHPDPQVLLRHQVQLLKTLVLVSFILNRKKSELDLVQDIQFLGIRLRLALGEALLPESKAREIAACACELSSLRVLSYHRVSQIMGSLNWASGLIHLGCLYLRPLQRYFHSLGVTDRFTRPRQSDPLVLASLLQQWQDLSFLTSGIPVLRNLSVSGGIYDFYGRLHTGVGHRHGGFPNFGYLNPSGPRAPHQLLGTQGGRGCPTSLGFRATGS